MNVRLIDVPHIDYHQLGGASDHIRELIDKFGFIAIDPGEELLSLNSTVNKLAKEFFNKPKHEKLQFISGLPGGKGYFPYKYEKALKAHLPDEKEFWHSQISSFDSQEEWPGDLIPWFEKSRELFLVSLKLSKLISKLILQAYQIPFNEVMFEGDWSTLRQIYYPRIEQKKEGIGEMAAEHTGIQFLGLQWPGTQEGLEFFTPTSEWVRLQNIKKLLTVNVGETLQAYSQNQLKATLHRVRKYSSIEERQAIVFFYHLNPETVFQLGAEKVIVRDWILNRVRDISDESASS